MAKFFAVLIWMAVAGFNWACYLTNAVARHPNSYFEAGGLFIAALVYTTIAAASGALKD